MLQKPLSARFWYILYLSRTPTSHRLHVQYSISKIICCWLGSWQVVLIANWGHGRLWPLLIVANLTLSSCFAVTLVWSQCMNHRPWTTRYVSSQYAYLITCLCTLVQLVVSGLSTFPAVVDFCLYDCTIVHCVVVMVCVVFCFYIGNLFCVFLWAHCA